MARQTTFYNAKAVEVSTPTIKGHSAIAKSYVKGTMERWVSQCPHCKGFHELRWEDIRYEYDTIETHGEKTYKVKDVWYLCPECACISDEVTEAHDLVLHAVVLRINASGQHQHTIRQFRRVFLPAAKHGVLVLHIAAIFPQ